MKQERIKRFNMKFEAISQDKGKKKRKCEIKKCIKRILPLNIHKYCARLVFWLEGYLFTTMSMVIIRSGP